MEISTPRMRLVLRQRDEILAWVETLSDEDRAAVSPVWLEGVRAARVADPWTFPFRMVLRSDGEVAGSCGFKGAPGAKGVVEIAYVVEPQHRGRGLATEAARALVAHALSCPDVRRVIAHTRPEVNASCTVLGRCGFVRDGEVVDPVDGPIWRWVWRGWAHPVFADRPRRGAAPEIRGAAPGSFGWCFPSADARDAVHDGAVVTLASWGWGLVPDDGRKTASVPFWTRMDAAGRSGSGVLPTVKSSRDPRPSWIRFPPPRRPTR